MVREIMIGAASVLVVAGVIAAVKYAEKKKKENQEIERIYVDEFNLGELKSWFSERMKEDDKGMIIIPTEENIAKMKMDKIVPSDNMVIQCVYNVNKDEIVEYREVTFSEMSDKMKKLIDENGGVIVFDK